jgi:hypothetical protein
MQDWGRKWKINLGDEPLLTSEFSLVKRRCDAFIYYGMEFERGGDEAWWDCALVQFGTNHLSWAPQRLLPPWDESQTEKYQTATRTFLRRVSANTRRLIGEVRPMKRPTQRTSSPIANGVVTPSQVTILLARDAVDVDGTTKRDLLIVVTKSLSVVVSGSGTGSGGGPDGTALGDPS